MKRRLVAALMAVAFMSAAAGCTGPPPALPTKVLEQGTDALTKDHPELTTAQASAGCRSCHKASDAPAQ